MKHLQWGILSTGNIAGKFATSLNSTDQASLRAVASRDTQKAQAFAQEHGIPASYGSYQELLADPAVDAVYIGLPNHLHMEWSIKCAQAGKHILCEKPATANAAQLEQVLKVVKEHDVFYMEAFMYRCHPQWKKVRELLDGGAIGEVRAIKTTFAFNMGLALENIRLSNPAAGGALMDVGCYCVSFCRLIAGEEPDSIRGVAHIGTESRVDEQTAGVLRFPSGIVASFECATQVGIPTSATVHGSSGSLTVGNPWFPSEQNAPIIVNEGGKEETIQVSQPGELYANEALTVAQYLEDRQTPAMSWEDSLGQMRTLDALRTDMGLVFDLEKES